MTNEELTVQVEALTRSLGDLRRLVFTELETLKSQLAGAQPTAELVGLVDALNARMSMVERGLDGAIAKERYTNNQTILRKMIRDILREGDAQ